MAWMIATDIGGTKVATALVSDKGQIHAFHHEPVSQLGIRPSLNQLLGMYEKAAGQVAAAELVGWSIAVPGIWDASEQKVWAPNIKEWNWIPLGKLLAEKVSVPVFVESDRTAALLGEAWMGEGRGYRDFLFLIVGTGIGLGALCAGKTISGAHAVGGAVGWFVMPALFGEANRPLTWEKAAAGPAMTQKYAAATGQTFDARELFVRAAQGEAAAREVVRQTAVYLGLGISNLIAAFDPELVVLGGGVSQGFTLMEPVIHETLDCYAQPISRKKVRLAASRLGSEGPLLGLAAIGFQIADFR